MEIDAQDTALVLTDPQNDFLSPDGVSWALVGASVEENGTVEHIEQLLKAPKDGGYEVFVSPHYYQARSAPGTTPVLLGRRCPSGPRSAVEVARCRQPGAPASAFLRRSQRRRLTER